MNEREVMKQALEALEATLGTLIAANEQGVITDTIWFSNHETLFDHIASEADALRERLAQPAQEPMVCRFCHDERGEWVWQCNHCGEIDDSREPSPPQRQPLTDEQIEFVFFDMGQFAKVDLKAFARAIEAAHGIGVKK